VAEHLSRKELKQDKIHDALEHGAEAVYSHSQAAAILVAVAIAAILVYGGWKFYNDRQTVLASAALDDAMKVYNAPIRQTNVPLEPGELTFADPQTRAQEASQKFRAVADKYPRTNPGRLARYYEALTLLDLEKQNQAIESLKKVAAGSDKELSAMAQYQMATIHARTGRTDEAIKAYRALASQKSALVPRALVLLDLADLLRLSNPGEAANLYQQVKKEYPNPTISERADRGLDMLAPKS
jgi:predicted negative regulator of RcsB-dependent stress response